MVGYRQVGTWRHMQVTMADAHTCPGVLLKTQARTGHGGGSEMMQQGGGSVVACTHQPVRGGLPIQLISGVFGSPGSTQDMQGSVEEHPLPAGLRKFIHVLSPFPVSPSLRVFSTVGYLKYFCLRLLEHLYLTQISSSPFRLPQNHNSSKEKK